MLCRKGVRWVYRLERNYSWESSHRLPEDFFFRDGQGKVRLIIEKEGTITVTAGYAWDGCSPKFCAFDILFGTPDGIVHAETGRPKTYYASLVHDALYQFLREAAPLTRRDADRFFLRLLKESDFLPAHLYWLVVRVLGWFVWRGTEAKRQWHGTRERVADLLPSSHQASGLTSP
jgi:hypothetical protein